MTKEELEKEAREYLAEHSEYSEVFEQTFVAVDILTAMVDFAEPREKRIAELEHQLTHRNCLDCSNHSSKLRMRTLELEKENAELKSENQKWKVEWQEQVQKATDEGYARTLQTIQLTNAREIIKDLLSLCEGETDSKLVFTRAEQFLNSEVEK